MPPAEDFLLMIKVDQIDEELFAFVTNETLRMPRLVSTSSFRNNHHITDFDSLSAMRTVLKNRQNSTFIRQEATKRLISRT